MMQAPDMPRHGLHAAGSLPGWLATAALPQWHAAGIDADGGFFEALDLDGKALTLPRRARVAPRQLYVFCHARELGWPVKVDDIVRRGVAYIESRFGRPDGFYRTLVSADGDVLDDTALLYDQAFVLLGLAAAATVAGSAGELEERAGALRERIARRWRVADGQFRSGDGSGERREANPHMHLLEACLAWSGISSDPAWRRWADDLVRTALERFIDPASGALFETHDGNGHRLHNACTHAVEPGHQYEWAWLLLRAHSYPDPGRPAAALRLIDVAESHGVRGGVAVNGLDEHLAVRDSNARLWVQTERLRACTVAARMTSDARYRRAAAEAMEAIGRYLATPHAGLWYDECKPDGTHAVGVVHASTLYHLVSAARELV